jgi:hypothetical protein
MSSIQIATVVILGLTLCVQAYTITVMVKTSRIRKRTALLNRLSRANLRIDSNGNVVRAGGPRA